MIVPTDAHIYDIWTNGGDDPWDSGELTAVEGSILCYGPRGCGKTFLANAFFNAANREAIAFGAEDILNTPDAKLASVIEKAGRRAGRALLIEDIDNVLAGLRHRPSAHQALMQQLKRPPSGAVIFSTATRPDDLQPREIETFQYVLPVFYGDRRLREVTLVCYGAHVTLGPDVDLFEVAKSTEWWSAQELMSLVTGAQLDNDGILTADNLRRHLSFMASNIVPEVRAKRMEELLRFSADRCTSRHIREEIKYRFGPNFLVPSKNVPTPIQINAEKLIMIEKQFNGPVGVNVEAGGRAQSFTVSQNWSEAARGIDMPELTAELSTLLLKLEEVSRHREGGPATIQVIAAAKVEAAKGNGARALEYLSKAGAWVVDVAKDLSVKIAAETIAKAIGLS